MMLNVMSFNIRYDDGDSQSLRAWQNRKSQIVEIIQRFDCDVVGIQEANISQVYDLRDLLPEYSFITRSREMNAFEGESTPIFFKKSKFQFLEGDCFWLSDTPSVPASTSYGNGLPRIVVWGKFLHLETQIPFYFYNTHLDHEVRIARIKSASQLSEFILMRNPDLKNIFITGDFNVDSSAEETIKILTKHFRDISQDFLKKTTSKGTFHDWTGRKNGPHIDYIFVSQNLEVLDFQICYYENKYFPSDHFPIFSKINF